MFKWINYLSLRIEFPADIAHHLAYCREGSEILEYISIETKYFEDPYYENFPMEHTTKHLRKCKTCDMIKPVSYWWNNNKWVGFRTQEEIIKKVTDPNFKG